MIDLSPLIAQLNLFIQTQQESVALQKEANALLKEIRSLLVNKYS